MDQLVILIVVLQHSWVCFLYCYILLCTFNHFTLAMRTYSHYILAVGLHLASRHLEFIGLLPDTPMCRPPNYGVNSCLEAHLIYPSVVHTWTYLAMVSLVITMENVTTKLTHYCLFSVWSRFGAMVPRWTLIENNLPIRSWLTSIEKVLAILARTHLGLVRSLNTMGMCQSFYTLGHYKLFCHISRALLLENVDPVKSHHGASSCYFLQPCGRGTWC